MFWFIKYLNEWMNESSSSAAAAFTHGVRCGDHRVKTPCCRYKKHCHYSHGISEIALLNLQEAYSLSVLMYASPVLALSKQISELNACWNNANGRIFGYQWWEPVKAVIYGLGRLNVTYKIIVRKLKFYKRLYFKFPFYMMCSGQPC